MTIKHFSSQEEMDEEFELIEERCMDYTYLLGLISEAENNVKEFEKRIAEFKDEYPEIVALVPSST